MLTIDLDEGDRAYASKDLDRALEIYSSAREQGLEDFRVCYNLGVVLRDLDKLEDSIEPFERAATLRPDDASTLNNLAIVRERLGQPRDCPRVVSRCSGPQTGLRHC